MGKNFGVFGKAFCSLSVADMKKIKVLRKNQKTQQVNRIACGNIEKTVTTIYKISDFTDIFNDMLQGIKSDSVADTKEIQHAHVQHDGITAIIDELENRSKQEKIYCKRDLENKLCNIDMTQKNLLQVLLDYMIKNGLPVYLLPDAMGKRENIMAINGLVITSKEIYEVTKAWANLNNKILPFEDKKQGEVFKRKDFHNLRKNFYDYAIKQGV